MRPGGSGVGGSDDSLMGEIQDPDEQERVRAEAGHRPWDDPPEEPTTLVLVRHGVTEHTTGRRFSGGLGGEDPGLSEEGREQARLTAEWLVPLAASTDAVISSPVRRTRETAEVLTAALGHDAEPEAAFAEMEFGTWDGRSFTELAEEQPDELEEWLGSLDVRAGGSGESFREVQARVLHGLERVLEAHRGRTVVVVSHVTPIKTIVAYAVDAPLLSVYRMELAPASVSIVSFWPPSDRYPGPRSSLRLFNALPPGRAVLGDPLRW